MSQTSSVTSERNNRLIAAFLLPILLVNMVAFIVPVINLAFLSLQTATATGALGNDRGLETWGMVLVGSFYWQMLGRTIWVATLITGMTLVLSYPLALFVSRMEGIGKTFLVILCISPLLISVVVRTYGWMVILGDQGFMPELIRMLGLTPPRLINNQTGLIIGMTEILMPYMILALLSGFGKLDPTLEQAAGTLGARPFTVFRRIIVPLSLPGILLGCLLCFVLAVSSFITPKMLSGGRVLLLATEIYDQAIVTLNWPLAACLSILVLLVFGTALFFYGQLSKIIDLV